MSRGKGAELAIAARDGEIATVTRLLDEGVPLFTTVEMGYDGEDYYQSPYLVGAPLPNAVHAAVEGGQVAVLEELLRRTKDASVGDYVMTGLVYSRHAHTEYANCKPIHLVGMWPARKNLTANVPAIIKLLVAAGANVNKKVNAGVYGAYEGYTPLHIAAFKGRTDVLRPLMDAGARLDEKTSSGNTAIELAVLAGHGGTVAELRAMGAKIPPKKALDEELKAQIEAISCRAGMGLYPDIRVAKLLVELGGGCG